MPGGGIGRRTAREEHGACAPCSTVVGEGGPARSTPPSFAEAPERFAQGKLSASRGSFGSTLPKQPEAGLVVVSAHRPAPSSPSFNTGSQITESASGALAQVPSGRFLRASHSTCPSANP